METIRRKGNTKPLITGILIGSFLTCGILYFASPLITNQSLINNAWYSKEVADISTDYILILNDVREGHTTTEYAAALIERNIDRLSGTLEAGTDLINEDAQRSIEYLIDNMKASNDLVLASDFDQLTNSVEDFQGKLTDLEVALNN